MTDNRPAPSSRLCGFFVATGAPGFCPGAGHYNGRGSMAVFINDRPSLESEHGHGNVPEESV